MDNTRLRALHEAGQSIWLDYIDRAMLHNGDLQRRITDDRLTGMTSNPSIFEKALAQGTAYDEQLRGVEGKMLVEAIFELVETEDVRKACDIFAATYQETNGRDGFVSIEVSPGVAHNATATAEEVRRLWKTVDRPNVMVKIPGTTEGCKAVQQAIADGVNVNITLLFSVDAYAGVIEAYLAGLEDRVTRGLPIDRIASVASFFVSRVDTEIDKRLDAIGGDVLALRGKAAIANAKMAYQLFLQQFAGPRWEALAKKGAHVQRPLWASTSTKNPAYRDVMYVEQLIGPNTVDTMPPATIDAFRDHGEVARTVDMDVDAARKVLSDLERAGISIKDVTDLLLGEGIASFEKSFQTLTAGITTKMSQLHPSAT